MGRGGRPVVVAWHGLARTGRDMDELARHLAPRYRVICPDTLGRGLSQWAARPSEEYCLAFYARLAADLFDELGIETAQWVGTSMGGAIGTVCAAGIMNRACRAASPACCSTTMRPNWRLPPCSASVRTRPAASVRHRAGTGDVLPAGVPALWLAERCAQWRHLTETSTRRLPDGRVTPHYDPAMVQQFTHHTNDYLIWDHYDALDIPVLCLRGAESDLVLRETTAEMLTRGPGARGLAQVVEVPGCGHAPALNVPEHFALVDGFLAKAG